MTGSQTIWLTHYSYSSCSKTLETLKWYVSGLLYWSRLPAVFTDNFCISKITSFDRMCLKIMKIFLFIPQTTQNQELCPFRPPIHPLLPSLTLWPLNYSLIRADNCSDMSYMNITHLTNFWFEVNTGTCHFFLHSTTWRPLLTPPVWDRLYSMPVHKALQQVCSASSRTKTVLTAGSSHSG